MTDLVTRLLALAAEVDPLWPETITGEQITQVSCALREAADALEETTRKLNHESYCHDKAAQDRTKAELERDALKAKLAAAEIVGNVYEHTIANWRARAEKAEAEAAALREAAEKHVKNIDLADYGAASKALVAALSQPGPGAALLERVKKLEAVAEAAHQVKLRMPAVRMWWEMGLAAALAALDAPAAHDGDGDAD